MTEAELEKIEARAKAALEYPEEGWPRPRDLDLCGQFVSWAEAELAGEAREDVPALLAEVRRLKLELAAIREEALKRIAPEPGATTLELVRSLVFWTGPLQEVTLVAMESEPAKDKDPVNIQDVHALIWPHGPKE